MRRTVTAVWLAVLLAGLAFACAGRGGASWPWRAPARPVLELAGQSRAVRVSGPGRLPPGPGAEGGPGDLLLENELVRFVVAGSHRAGLMRLAGNVIDAAFQGSEDRLRMLTPLLGADPPTRPLYALVRVEQPGGLDVPAVVVAEGRHWAEPAVTVKTTYTLRPGTQALEIETEVVNGTQDMLALFGLGDRLYHGRTLRFAQGMGLMPLGAEGATRHVACLHEDSCFGLSAAANARMEARHRAGFSEVLHCTVDIPAGESRSYSRRLVAAAGGPGGLYEALMPVPGPVRCRVGIELRDRVSGEPVPYVPLTLAPGEPPDPASALLLLTDRDGRAEALTHAGRHEARVHAAGRPPMDPLQIDCAPGQGLQAGLSLSPRSEALVRTHAEVGGYVVPVSARVGCYLVGRSMTPYPPAPPFPWPGDSGVALLDGTAAAPMPLTPISSSLPARCLLVASKGPLYECAVSPVEAEPGERPEVALRLRRVVEPGDYVSVDFRQHSAASPDCALTLAERALADACEGLDAAVVSDPAWRPNLPVAGDAGCALLPGLRIELDGLGRFSAYPLGSEGELPGLVDAAVRPGVTGAGLTAALREALPDALIQVDAPLEPQAGYFALSGEGISTDFDALELLSGGDVESARRLLPTWFELLNGGRRVLVTGGSGSRAVAGEVAGLARTFVHCPRRGSVATADEVRAAILALKGEPNAFVSNGPFIEASLDGRPIGSTHSVRGAKARLAVRVRAPMWVDVTKLTLYRNGEIVASLDVPRGERPLRCDRVFEVDASADGWFVVVVEGERPMTVAYGAGSRTPTPFAVTNPFWLDADGDGRVQPAGP